MELVLVDVTWAVELIELMMEEIVEYVEVKMAAVVLARGWLLGMRGRGGCQCGGCGCKWCRNGVVNVKNVEVRAMKLRCC